MFRTPVAVATTVPDSTQVLDRSLPGIGRIFKLHEAADILRISRSEMYRVLDSGLLKTVGAHKARRVLESDLVTYVQSLTTNADVRREKPFVAEPADATAAKELTKSHRDNASILDRALASAKAQAKSAKAKSHQRRVSP